RACACWGCWGALHFWGGRCAGLFGSWGPDGGALCCGSVWGCGLSDVPLRGLGALGWAWRFVGCGSWWAAGCGLWVLRFGYGDRGGAAGAWECISGGGCGAGRWFGRPAACWLCGFGCGLFGGCR